MSGSVTGLVNGINPTLPQGTLNRLRGSVQIPNYPSLNIVAEFLGRSAITWERAGQTTLMLPTLTGTVQSQEPYQMATVRIELVKSMQLAASYEQQMLTNSNLGDVNLIGDSAMLPSYTIYNAAIMSVSALKFDGTDPGFIISIEGYYAINSGLWNLS